MNHLTIKINWVGPYTPEDVATLDDGNGLYLFTGKRKGQRSESHIQYFGITELAYRDRFKQHHKLPTINRDLGIWLGKVDYHHHFALVQARWTGPHQPEKHLPQPARRDQLGRQPLAHRQPDGMGRD